MASDRRSAASPGIDFGQRLKAARERRGATIREISEATKISVTILEAIEGNHPKRLPGGIFARSFVKTYAAQVGLDPDETLLEFQRAFPDYAPAPERAPVDAASDVAPDRRLWPLLLVLVLLLGAGALGTAWYRGWRPTWLPPPLGSGEVAIGGVQPLAPPRSAATPFTETPPPAQIETSAAQGPVDEAPSSTIVPTADAGVTEPVRPATQAPTAPLPSSPPAAAGATPTGVAPSTAVAPGNVGGVAVAAAGVATAPEDPLRLVVAPTGPCWLKLTVDGVVRVSRLVQPGERLEFEAATGLQIEAGDAAAFAYTLDGRPGRPLGRPGRLARVSIDRSNAAEFVAP
jgi:cytoskeleton protein RodZ